MYLTFKKKINSFVRKSGVGYKRIKSVNYKVISSEIKEDMVKRN